MFIDPRLSNPPGPGIIVAAVILFDAAGRVLGVRKHGTTLFMQPGGKIEPGETPRDAAAREVREELGLVLDADALAPLAQFLTDTANEPGLWLRSHVFAYLVPVVGERADAEIAEARWFDVDALADAPLAPLFRELVPTISACVPSGSRRTKVKLRQSPGRNEEPRCTLNP